MRRLVMNTTKAAIAEFIGTFTLTFIGAGTGAAVAEVTKAMAGGTAALLAAESGPFFWTVFGSQQFAAVLDVRRRPPQSAESWPAYCRPMSSKAP
jgi:hypothetical protein